MSEQRTVSDLVFRDLAPEAATGPADRHEAWEAQLREELGKLRPARPAPRVVPATEAAALHEGEPSPAE
jgi:hypothetical protein